MCSEPLFLLIQAQSLTLFSTKYFGQLWSLEQQILRFRDRKLVKITQCVTVCSVDKNTEPSPSKRKICVLFFESSKHFNNFHYKAVIHAIRKKNIKKRRDFDNFPIRNRRNKKKHTPRILTSFLIIPYVPVCADVRPPKQTKTNNNWHPVSYRLLCK